MNIIQMRRGMGASGGGGILPPGYRQIEAVCKYRNTAYIDTGITLDFTEKISGRYKIEMWGASYQFVFGYYKDENSNCTRVIRNSTGDQNAIFNYNTRAGGGGTTIGIKSLGNINYFEMSPTEYVSNSTIVYGRGVSGLSFNDTIKVFDWLSESFMYFYEFAISGKCNFVPCVNPNGVVGFYDTIRDAFYTSATSDPFYEYPPI